MKRLDNCCTLKRQYNNNNNNCSNEILNFTQWCKYYFPSIPTIANELFGFWPFCDCLLSFLPYIEKKIIFFLKSVFLKDLRWLPVSYDKNRNTLRSVFCLRANYLFKTIYCCLFWFSLCTTKFHIIECFMQLLSNILFLILLFNSPNMSVKDIHCSLQKKTIVYTN